MTNQDIPRVTYSVAEVASMTGLSEVLIRKRVRLGLIPSTTVGDRRLIPSSWLDKLADEAEVSA